jgi:hypothetical protein
MQKGSRSDDNNFTAPKSLTPRCRRRRDGLRVPLGARRDRHADYAARFAGEAVNTPRVLYFTYGRYGPSESQTPIGVQQGLLSPSRPAKLRNHAN